MWGNPVVPKEGTQKPSNVNIQRPIVRNIGGSHASNFKSNPGDTALLDSAT